LPSEQVVTAYRAGQSKQPYPAHQDDLIRAGSFSNPLFGIPQTAGAVAFPTTAMRSNRPVFFSRGIMRFPFTVRFSLAQASAEGYELSPGY